MPRKINVLNFPFSFWSCFILTCKSISFISIKSLTNNWGVPKSSILSSPCSRHSWICSNICRLIFSLSSKLISYCFNSLSTSLKIAFLYLSIYSSFQKVSFQTAFNNVWMSNCNSNHSLIFLLKTYFPIFINFIINPYFTTVCYLLISINPLLIFQLS